MRKKNSIILILIVILAASLGVYVYQKFISEKTPEQVLNELKARARKISEEWLPEVLNQEFLPAELNVEFGADIGGGTTTDKNTFGYNWHYSGKDFYSAINYNDEKPGISSYVLSVSWDEKIDLNQEIARELLESYFHLPKIDLKCETRKSDRDFLDVCQGSQQDQENNWHIFYIISRTLRERDHTLLIHYLTPLESETYGKELF